MVNYRPQKLLGILAPTQYARVAKPSPRFRVRVWLRDWFLPFLVAALGTQSHCNAATIGMLSDGRCFCDSYGLDAFAQKMKTDSLGSGLNYDRHSAVNGWAKPCLYQYVKQHTCFNTSDTAFTIFLALLIGLLCRGVAIPYRPIGVWGGVLTAVQMG